MFNNYISFEIIFQLMFVEQSNIKIVVVNNFRQEFSRGVHSFERASSKTGLVVSLRVLKH